MKTLDRHFDAERDTIQNLEKECCEALRVSRSGYYRWQKAEPGRREKERPDKRSIILNGMSFARVLIRSIDMKTTPARAPALLPECRRRRHVSMTATEVHKIERLSAVASSISATKPGT